MSESDKAQAAMDRLFGVKEPRINVERPAYLDDVKRNADRALQVSAASASYRKSQEILVDKAFLEVFGGTTGGAGGRLKALGTFPDRIVAHGVDGKLYKVPYTVQMDGVTFGAPQLIDNPSLKTLLGST